MRVCSSPDDAGITLLCRPACLVVAAALLAFSTGVRAQQFEPVTDEVLRDPSPEDWPAWRGTHRSQGYSPLDQITRDNVDDLQLVWGVGDRVREFAACPYRLQRRHVSRWSRRCRAGAGRGHR